MRRTILAPAELDGAALTELKNWLAITTSTEDALLTGLLGAAAEACESFTGSMPLSQTCEEILPFKPAWQKLTTRPIQAITAIEGIPAEGPRITLPVDSYAIELDADGAGRVQINQAGAAGRVAVRFLAGIAPGWGSLPEALRHGILRLAAHLYRERDADKTPQPPAAITALWQPWRQMRIA